MIEKFAAAWPSLRKVIYILLAAGLAVAFTYGKVTAEQQASILESATQVLAFIGFVIAILYTPKGGKTIGDGSENKVEYHVTNVDEALARAKRLEAITYRGGGGGGVTRSPSVDQVAAAASSTIAELRARAEQALGRRTEG